jgi:nicotinic acid mononucleotide adenylyltransferase
MTFRRRAQTAGKSAVVFPGAFNPVTRAHLALARAALAWAPEVVFAIPRTFPHKEWDGPGLEARVELLMEAAAGEPGFSVACCEAGLFIDMARALRAAAPELERLLALCGRDAAERIVGWDYGAGPAIARQLDEYELLVAPRGGLYPPPPELAPRIHALTVGEGLDEISSTEVRARIAAGAGWEEFTPPGIAARVRALYSDAP